MKKMFKAYCAVWAVLVVLFNIIAFVAVGGAGIFGYTPSFWIGYGVITIAFIGQFICAYFALKDSDVKKLFYNVSLVTTSYTGLILSFVSGVLCMILSPWVGMILSAGVLGFNVIAVVKASAAIRIVDDMDNKTKERTLFIRSLTVDAESLVLRAKNDITKAECKKVFEAVRYADPMSDDALALIESEITVKFAELSEAVAEDDSEDVCALSAELLVLLGDRNKKCKLLK